MPQVEDLKNLNSAGQFAYALQTLLNSWQHRCAAGVEGLEFRIKISQLMDMDSLWWRLKWRRQWKMKWNLDYTGNCKDHSFPDNQCTWVPTRA